MHTHTERFGNKLTTRCALLAGVSWVDLDELGSGSFDLVAKHLNEGSPTRIVDRLVQSTATVGHHLLYAQVFYCKQRELLRQAVRQLVQEVFTLALDLGVQLGKVLALPTRLVLGIALLRFFQPLLKLAIPTGVNDLFTRGQCGKRFQAKEIGRASCRESV